MPRLFKTTVLLAAAAMLPALALRAQQAAPAALAQPPATKAAAKAAPTTKTIATTPTDPVDRIKEEGLKRSQVMATLSYLTDVIGPRLTGSPNMKRANEWTRDKLAAWGLANAHLEAWGPFGRGWSLKRFSAQVIEPQCIPLDRLSQGLVARHRRHARRRRSSTSTPRPRPTSPTYKGKLKGAIVLTSPIREVAARFEPLATRKTDSELLALADAAEPDARGFGRRAGPGTGPRPGRQRQAGGRADGRGGSAGARPAAGRRRRGQPRMGRFRCARDDGPDGARSARRLQFLAEEGAALLVEPSTQGDGGTFFVQSASIPGRPLPGWRRPGRAAKPARLSLYDKDAPKITAQIVLAKEHYNRLVRMCEQGEKLKMAVDLAVQFHDDDLMAYNTVAEIPGTDLKDEIVMLGGHMDSWHSGTGATDNGAGVSVAMEAVRILKALDLKPRRTIRIALWSGEEAGAPGLARVRQGALRPEPRQACSAAVRRRRPHAAATEWQRQWIAHQGFVRLGPQARVRQVLGLLQPR